LEVIARLMFLLMKMKDFSSLSMLAITHFMISTINQTVYVYD